MLSRSLPTIAALSLALTLPAASAQAADPLLSGYGGPGGGEQAVLGGTTVNNPKSSSASASSAGQQGQDPATASLKAAPAPSSGSATSSSNASGGANSTLTRTPQHKKSSSSSSKTKDTGHDDDQGATQGHTTTPATLPGAPQVVAYPTRAGEVGGLPISAPGLLLVVLGVAAATLMGLGLRRISAFDRVSDPQVSGR